MNTKNLFVLLVMLISVLVSACASSVPANPADRFAGCAAGTICGDLNNTTVKCQWEMTLGDVKADVFEYKFSKSMSGECPALGGGTLTMQSDGTLVREHKTPYFTASGVLTSK